MNKNGKTAENASDRLQRILEELYVQSGKEHAEALAKNAIHYMDAAGNGAALQEELEVCLIKGGTYKIKGYYLEDNELMDIRGASQIITEVQERIVPDYLRDCVGFDCVLYNGGGNLLALVPKDTDPEIGRKMEQEAQRHLVTAQTAYHISKPCKLSSLLGVDYKRQLSELEQELTARKKAKFLFQPVPVSDMLGQQLLDAEIQADAVLEKPEKYCEACRKRLASYRLEQKLLCGGCLHKVLVGKTAKETYIEKYRDYLNEDKEDKKQKQELAHKVTAVSSLEKLGDDIAVIYADGNNMGGIIQNFTKLTEMMDFSDFVRKTMPEIVYGAMGDTKITRAEIVAMGGDDIFLLVPGQNAVDFAANLIQRYNDAFGKKFPKANSTLSAGICIAKHDTPVKVMLESAEEKLSDAKDLVKKEKCAGSLSFQILTTYENYREGEQIGTLLPYSLEAAKEILSYVKELKKNGNATASQLYNLSEAFHQADLEEEASMFLAYTNSKAQENKRILPPQKLGDFVYQDGYYRKDGRSYFIWDDLIDLMQYSNEVKTS